MKKNVVDESADRINKTIRRRASQEIVRKRGPAPGTGGRPPEDDPKDYRLSIRFNREQEQAIKEAAEKDGETVAEFIRNAALEKAEMQVTQ